MLPSTPESPTASMPRCAQCRENVSIDLSGEDHLRHFERGVVSDAAAFDDRLFDAELLCQLAQLLAAAMDHADANADLVQQRQLFRQRGQVFLILRDLAGEFDDKRLALEALNVRQRLAQEIETELIVDGRMVI